VPGAIVTYVALKFSPGTPLEEHIKLIGGGAEGWAVFAVVSLVIGYAIQPPSHILNWVYDHTYRARRRQQVDHLYEFATARATKSIPNILETGSVYAWAELDVRSRDPTAGQSVDLIQGVSKLFRSLALICLVGFAVALYKGAWMFAIILALLTVIFFLVYAERRWNATYFVYQRFKALHEGGSKS
jgi:hypothetical protein